MPLFNEYKLNEKTLKALRSHPTYALENAKKHFDLTEREEDIIKTHMFPVTFTPPKYLESWIVDVIDDISGVYERYKSSRNEFQTAVVFLVVIILKDKKLSLNVHLEDVKIKNKKDVVLFFILLNGLGHNFIS